METKVHNVLFLCTGNSARSIMAESILNQVGADRFRGFSAGSHPRGRVHPYAIDLLKSLNRRTADLRSSSWNEFTSPNAVPLHFVFTLCDSTASETRPVWPGQPITAHWGLPDPAAVVGSEAIMRAAFVNAYRMLNNRISIFTSLPMHSLDKLSLQRRLDEIGKTLSESA